MVPDSGTGELEGLTGRIVIVITNGNHSYEFEPSPATDPAVGA